MNRRSVFFTTALLACIIFITCRKEYSYEGGNAPPPPPAPVAHASFTLKGSPNSCQDFEVNGTYVSGIRLLSSNTVEINVNVTAVGNYFLTTDTIDGIWFSNSGTFTNTGDQIITLDGNGTPASPGNLIFGLLTSLSNCILKVVVTDPEPLAIYVLESGFGNPTPCTPHIIAGTYTSNSGLSNSNNVTIRVYVSSPGNFTIATNTVNGMMFSYTGRFTTIGSQDVILYGSGTPAMQGNYTFIPEIVGPHPLGGQSCAFLITVN